MGERKGRRETLGMRLEECQGSVFPRTVRKCFDVSMEAAVLRLASLATVTQLIADLQLILIDNLVSFIILLPTVKHVFFFLCETFSVEQLCADQKQLFHC